VFFYPPPDAHRHRAHAAVPPGAAAGRPAGTPGRPAQVAAPLPAERFFEPPALSCASL